MVKKRIIGVVTVRGGQAVQSFGFRKYLPLGDPTVLLENLDRWGADEILLNVIDRSLFNRGPSFDLIKKCSNIGLGTPLIYSGGIRNSIDAVEVIKNGADRIVVNSLIHENFEEIKKICESIGQQSIIISLPIFIKGQVIKYLNYRDSNMHNLNVVLPKKIKNYYSELLLIDALNEGGFSGSFKPIDSIIDSFNKPLILFGGLNNFRFNSSLYRNKRVCALAIGNFLNYKEHSIQLYKDNINSTELRPSSFLHDKKTYL